MGHKWATPFRCSDHNPAHISLFLHMCQHVTQSHIPWFHHPNKPEWNKIMKPLTISPLPTSYHSLPLRPKYLPQHSVLQRNEPVFSPECERPTQNCRCAYVHCYPFIRKMGTQKTLDQIHSLIIWFVIPVVSL
jgi:hypothetical protein